MGKEGKGALGAYRAMKRMCVVDLRRGQRIGRRISAVVVWVIVAAAGLVVPTSAQAEDDPISRLAARMAAIPTRWSTIPPPVIPPTGRSVEDVLEAATQDETQQARSVISQLTATPEEQWSGLLEQVAPKVSKSEVLLWFPGFLAQEEMVQDVNRAATTLNAWLALAEKLGRRDVLQFGAGSGLMVLSLRIRPEALMPIATAWIQAPGGSKIEARGRADVAARYAAVLFRLGRNEEALEGYQKARGLFVEAGTKLGEANAVKDEAAVLFRLGRNKQEEARRNKGKLSRNRAHPRHP